MDFNNEDIFNTIVNYYRTHLHARTFRIAPFESYNKCCTPKTKSKFLNGQMIFIKFLNFHPYL